MNNFVLRITSVSKVFCNNSLYRQREFRACMTISILIILNLFFIGVTSSTCAASVSSSNAITQVQDNFSGSPTFVSTRFVAPGPASNALYYSYYYNPGEAIVRKVNSDDSDAWMTCLLFDPIQNSLAVDSTETLVYVGSNNNPLEVISLQASNGAVSTVQNFANIDGMYHGIKIMPLISGLGYYFVAACSADSSAYLCKYLFATTGSAQCQKITAFNTIGYGQLKLSDTKLFFIGSEPLSTYHMHYYKVTFGNTAVDWANKVLCTSGSCSVSYSESLLSADASMIYTFATFGSTQFLYFATFSSSNGNVVGSRYKSSVSCTEALGAVINGDYICLSIYCTNYMALVYNIVTAEFTIKQFTGTVLNGFALEPVIRRVVGVGRITPNGYTTKFYIQAIQAHSMFTTSAVTMSVLAAGTDAVVTETGVSILAPVTETVSNSSYTNQSESYSATGISTSDVYFQTKEQTFSIIESYSSQFIPELSCSSSGSTLITFSIGDYNGVTAPAWATIGSSSGLLQITSPSVSADTVFSFYVKSLVAGYSNPVLKLIKLTVVNCNVANCQTCNNVDGSICNTCNAGFTLSSGSCPAQNASSKSSTSSSKNSITSKSEVSNTSKDITITSQAIIGVTACLILASSLINSSSISTLWSLFNQLQLFFLLLITGAFIPEDVKNVIIGNKFAIPYYPLSSPPTKLKKFRSFAFLIFFSKMIYYVHLI